MMSCTAVMANILSSEYLSKSRSRNNRLDRHVRLRLSCLACHVVPIIADLSIGVSTPKTHLGALQVNPECRYGLKKDFWFGAITLAPSVGIRTEGSLVVLIMVNTRSVRVGNSSQSLGRGQVPSNLPPHLPPPIPNTFPHVDHAEGGDENQPHNLAHNSASTANQDVVATQLAAMQQQFGVFQLVLAQLLARNNPVQHVPALSESQGQSHIAPAQQPLPDDVTRRLDNLEKLVVEQRGAPPPCHAADSIPHPLNTNITLEPYPTGFRIPQLETYDGTKDPDDHLHAFYSCMQAQNASDALMCKIFPSTLRAVISSLSHERFRDSLLKHHATTFSEFDDAAWKNQPITFTSADLDAVFTPHNDPLVTSVLINNCEVQRVLVDIGSAPDIMYFHCFESLGLDPALLQRCGFPVSPMHEVPNSYGNSNATRQPGGGQTLLYHLEDETRAVPVEDVEEVPIDDRNSSRKTQIGTRLSMEERAELIAFLRANNDVFAWTSVDMGERLQAIKEEVEKLLQVGFVRKVDYCEWVANPVLVKKANGKWRMCIDYTNLNQACPKNCYPMPSIDKLVEAASGNERLSLLDVYSRYHQVPMAPEDEEKTSFYAGDEIYCYMMMPFGLKNVGATYQKMMTIVFRAQIGKNLEVYIDDIVVKSLKAKDHLVDLNETFNNLRKNRMRLNPAKCIFGMESGKFLGFMVSRRGIEINLEKIRAIAEMEPSKSVKDIQRLTGRVAALHRFMSKSVDKCLPFFKIMRISDEAISLVLVREEAKQQKPIYYISSVIHGAELRYPIAGKAALAVVTSARKLRPYFQSHPIIVLTDQPLRQILQKLECSGRLIKWVVELGEFEITFQQRSAIRAQALVDFIIECTSCHSIPSPEPNDWTLYVDGASSSKGSGAGALLIGPNGYRSEHALKFNFDATNNMAEYEALLLGLQLALELKISTIQVYSDSQLVVNQINSICEVVDPMMVKYVVMLAEMKCKFQKFYGIVPEDKQEAMKLRKKASRYALVHGVLYKRSFSLLLLRCLNPYEAEYALREVHEGVCGSHVAARPLAHKVLRHYGIKVQFTFVYHPESNGMVESVNKCILEGIKLRLEQHKAKWADELNNVLSAYRTTSRTATRVPSFWVTHFDEGRNGQLLRENLDLLAEVKGEARIQILAGLTGFETRFGKLAPNWEGPYTVAEVPHPGAYVLQDAEGKRVPRVWNINNLKKFYP
ncbi:hypothetical protein SLEP1_g47775 [Rubroshorea leprosula]|uniref:RNase H type-1 domain-containing protein n=1 Tax=Rubroshorea leprosula TaxID=152421 RepID=A0AAV5LTD4_9ROSI|nr:hypothetical protein SLEP1_g47775 [Rubroshorea leprosula]